MQKPSVSASAPPLDLGTKKTMNDQLPADSEGKYWQVDDFHNAYLREQLFFPINKSKKHFHVDINK